MGRCYACDAKATGLRDRRPAGGELETACPRHADPSLVVVLCCMYCSEPTRKGSVVIDGDHAHKACHKDACSDSPTRDGYASLRSTR
jgi:hypothetical protein